ncbi:MAG: carboxypeptidase-like regulatory domain-containing protein [Bryobacterales bacterium]
MSALRTFSLILLALAAALTPCRAQVSTAQLTGAVTDPSGAAIPGAEVTVSNVATGDVWNTQTGPAGYYTVPLLPPGQYRINVQADGFKAFSRAGVTLAVAQVARLDFQLEVGAISEQIEVTADAPLLESETASLGQVVGTRTINDLPLNGRNYLGLAKLGAGVVEQRRGGLGADSGSFVANGVRAALNNYNLDGADNNTRIVDIQNGSHQVIQPSVDALQEFKIETANYSAEYGYSAGAVVNATLKSGTNQVHGSAFEFARNQAFDARDFFQPSDTPMPSCSGTSTAAPWAVRSCATSGSCSAVGSAPPKIAASPWLRPCLSPLFARATFRRRSLCSTPTPHVPIPTARDSFATPSSEIKSRKAVSRRSPPT